MQDISRRSAVCLGGCAALVASSSRAAGYVGSLDEDRHDFELDDALAHMDQVLFPNRKAMLAGAVLGGLVLFAVTRNPMGLLIGVAGGAVVGGLAGAAVHYIESRSNVLGSDIKNACLGDQRADLYHLAPYSNLLDKNIARVSAPLNPYVDTLNRYIANREPGPIPDDARKALTGIYSEVTEIGNKLDVLAGYAVKHRDAGAVYEDISPRIGLDADPRFVDHAQTWDARSQIKRTNLVKAKDSTRQILDMIGSTILK